LSRGLFFWARTILRQAVGTLFPANILKFGPVPALSTDAIYSDDGALCVFFSGEEPESLRCDPHLLDGLEAQGLAAQIDTAPPRRIIRVQPWHGILTHAWLRCLTL
jgi:hypothetical protein